MNNMTWNYRVIRQDYSHKPDGETEVSYAIYEVYYDDDDKPKMVSIDPVYPSGETLEELELDIANYMMALTKPVLNYKDFENE